jgi:hypothetical protein
MSKKILITALTLLLTGCKIGVEAMVPFSGVLSDGVKETTADMYVEVASCTSYEDSRQPSHTLLEAQKTVPSLLTGAAYKECFTKQMNSWAHFTIPLAYGKFTKETYVDDGKLRILTLGKEGEKTVIIDAAKSLKKKINDLSNDKFSSFKASDITINVTLTNDTDEEKNTTIISSFVGNVPIINSAGNIIKKGQSLTLRLSDVTTQAIFSPAGYMQPAIMLHVK